MPSNLAVRRNATHLTPIQTFVSDESRPAGAARSTSTVINLERSGSHSTDIDHQTAPPEGQHPPVLEPPLKPKNSRSALFDLFSKPSTERIKDPLPAESVPGPDSKPVLNLPSMLVRQSRPTTQAGHQQRLEPPESRGLLRNARSSKDLRAASKKKDEYPKYHLKSHWRPPPLFQAYPQAVKHTSLEAPVSSSAVVAAERTPRTTTKEPPAEPQETAGKGQRLLHKMRSKSRLRDDPETQNNQSTPSEPDRSWSRKVYVLVTSGYLLQYAGDGAFDRMPEKILQLGAESAAVASNMLEGKHWVLEVLQAAKADNNSVRPSNKGFWSKLGMQSYTRREVSSMLLVFPSPEEMDAWRRAVRKLIGVDACSLAAEPEQLPAIKRYSSIIRHSTKEPEGLSTMLGPGSNHSSPTIYVPSLRDSGSTVVASESSFPSRKSRQSSSPSIKPEGLRPLSTFSTRNEQMIIGPALKSPGFFERHQTPTTTEFPKSAFDDSLLRINPTLPEPQTTLSRRWSLHSVSSKSSLTAGDGDRNSNNHSPSTQPPIARQVVHAPTQPLQGLRESEPSTPSTPSLQSFPEPPRKSVLNSTEMESIAESPPASSYGEPSKQPTMTSIEEVASSTNPSAPASSAVPGNQTNPPSSGTSSKRNSVFARPLPVVPQPRTSSDSHKETWLDSASGSTSVLNTPLVSPTLTSHPSHNHSLNSPTGDAGKAASGPVRSSNNRSASQPPSRTSPHQKTPSSPTTPKSPSMTTPQEHPLRRPASLQIRSDPAPFLAAPRSTATRASSTGMARQAQGKAAADRASVGRPPLLKPGGRIHSSAPHLHLPPPKPPPTMPLPEPPQRPTTSV